MRQPRRLAERLTFLLTLLLPALAAAQGTGIDRAALRHLIPGVPMVEAVSPAGRLQVGSGVVVERKRVATNCHVTRDAASIWVVQTGLRRRASAQAADVERDLCLLQVDDLESEPVPLGRSGELAQGQDLAAFGYTGGIGLQLSAGRVVALHPWRDGAVVQADTGFTSGASGGGLFTADGTLVGLLTFRLRGGSSHYYALPVDWVRAMLASASYAPVQPQPGRAFWEQEAANQPYFLRAASLEQTGQWSRLLMLAKRWSDEAADDAEPWYARALAEEGLGQLDAAVGALEHGVSLRRDDARSWVRLGLLQLRVGRRADAQRSLAAIPTRYPAVAQELVEALKAHAD